MFWDTFLSVLGVIGIVAVAAFVIVFLSDLFITIVDGTNGIFFKRHKKTIVESEPNKIIKKPKLLNRPVENLMAPKEEKKVLESQIDLEKADQEEEELKKVNLQRQNLVAQRSAIIPVQANKEEDEEEEEELEEIEEDEEDLDEEEIVEDEENDNEKIISEITKEFKNTLNENKKENVLQQRVEQDSVRAELEKEIEELRKQISEANEIIKELKEKQAGAKTPIVVNNSKEELEQRLETLRIRLKETEKELSANRKEFVPLRRVNKTLGNDKNKLRRKEAIIAKQKVLLYGVNNYVDINEEKAKKLSEELDLLEGLRLSVQHCEEVMQKNVDRYPILERVNMILTKNQSDLKADIQSLEEQLKSIETSDEDNGEDANE